MLNRGKRHTIYIDNLFINLKFFNIFRDYNIKIANIVRTSKIKKEKNEENKEKQKLKLYDLLQN